MSYNDDNRREGYSRDDGNYGGGQSAGYGGRGGQAESYYNEGERQSGAGGSGRRFEEDDRQGEYGRQAGGGRYDADDSGNTFSGSGGGRRYDDDNMGRGHGGQQDGGRRYDDEDTGGRHGGSGGGYGSAGESGGYDQDEAISQARQHGNKEDGNLFSQAMSFLGQNKHSNEDLDEQQMIGAHQQLYGNQSSARPHDANSLGAGAAMQALKMFNGGGAGAGGLGSQGGGNSQSHFIGMAMAQAGKLYDQQNGQGNVASGADKQSAVNTAAKLALQMYMKSQGQGGGGGPGGLMGLASKFL